VGAPAQALIDEVGQTIALSQVQDRRQGVVGVEIEVAGQVDDVGRAKRVEQRADGRMARGARTSRPRRRSMVATQRARRGGRVTVRFPPPAMLRDLRPVQRGDPGRFGNDTG
jgi:hypothetical protein